LQALEQLQGGCTDSDDGTVEAITVWCPEVIDALRQAIEQAEQAQPVAWRYNLKHRGSFEGVSTEYSPVKLSIGENWTPLYTAPPKRYLACVCGAVWEGETMVHAPRKREWFDCTDEQLINEVRRRGFVIRDAQIEQAEKQEPVAWYDPEVMNEDRGISWTQGQFHTAPLYTVPPPRKPLTEEHAKFVIAMHTTLVNAHYDKQRNTNIICEKTDSLGLVRAVEKTHGIGEKA
jgi:hypothetical protein